MGVFGLGGSSGVYSRQQRFSLSANKVCFRFVFSMMTRKWLGTGCAAVCSQAEFRIHHETEPFTPCGRDQIGFIQRVGKKDRVFACE